MAERNEERHADWNDVDAATHHAAAAGHAGQARVVPRLVTVQQRLRLQQQLLAVLRMDGSGDRHLPRALLDTQAKWQIRFNDRWFRHVSL
jgi:hypothetical protein